MKYWAPAISSLSYLLKSSAYSSSSPFPKQFLEGINKKNIIFQEMQMKNQNLSGYFLKSSIQNFSFLRNLDNKTHHLILEKHEWNESNFCCMQKILVCIQNSKVFTSLYFFWSDLAPNSSRSLNVFQQNNRRWRSSFVTYISFSQIPLGGWARALSWKCQSLIVLSCYLPNSKDPSFAFTKRRSFKTEFLFKSVGKPKQTITEI